MTTIDVTGDYVLAAGQTVSVTNEEALYLDGSMAHPSPTITNNGHIIVQGLANAPFGTVGIQNGVSSLYQDSFFRNGVGASFNVSAAGSAIGYDSVGPTASIYNDGMYVVLAANQATGVNAQRYAFINTGTFKVSGATALGVGASGGNFSNSGEFDVTGGSGGSIAFNIGTGFIPLGPPFSFDNAGTIKSIDTSVGVYSTGVYYDTAGAQHATFTNEGLIQADYAFVDHTWLADDGATIHNTGTIDGAIVMGTGAMGGTDTVENLGHIVGDIHLGNASDTYSGASGHLVGVVYGEAGGDLIVGGADNETFDGGDGNDVLNGGGGTDTASYADASAGVTVSLALSGAYQDTGGAGFDKLISIENLTGSNFSDTLTASVNGSVLTGGGGDDLLVGGAGNDTLIGGTGNDTATYAGATAGVTVDLTMTTAQNTFGAGHDTLTGVENLIGSIYGDTLTALAGGSSLSGGGGNDLLISGAGNDTLDGGAGVDGVSYASATAGVHVSLLVSGPQNTGGAGTDTLVSIEKLVGSNFADTLIAGPGGSTLNGGALGDDLIGGPGSDILNGGVASDFADYSLAAAGVTVTLNTVGFQNTIGAGVDELVGIEKLVGSSHDDHLTGDGGANALYGLAGNDVLVGGGNQDTLSGGAGSDTFLFYDVGDTIVNFPDTILDFQSGDHIDLHFIDANTGVAGDQAFHLGATPGHAGDIVVGPYTGGHTMLTLYVNADAAPDGQLILAGDHTGIAAGDFVL